MISNAERNKIVGRVRRLVQAHRVQATAEATGHLLKSHERAVEVCQAAFIEVLDELTHFDTERKEKS